MMYVIITGNFNKIIFKYAFKKDGCQFTTQSKRKLCQPKNVKEINDLIFLSYSKNRENINFLSGLSTQMNHHSFELMLDITLVSHHYHYPIL